MEKNRSFLMTSAFIAALGGFLFGFDTAVISGAEKAIQQLFGISNWKLGFTVAIALIGTVMGALFAGKPAEKYGRKQSLILIGLLYSVSALGSALSFNWYMLLSFRFIGGLGVGASSVIGPMYIAEISPARLRGRLVALFQLNIVVGIFMAFLFNYLIAGIGDNSWRWMLGAESVPALSFLCLLFLIPNTPRWLVKNNRIDEAESVLQRLSIAEPPKVLNEIKASLREEDRKVSVPLFQKKYSFAIITTILIAVFNQVSGINAIMYYAPRIFEMTGLAKDTALLQSVAIGLTNMIFTVLAMSIIDRFGRRSLLITGSLGMSVFLGLISHAFFTENFTGYLVMFYLIGFISFFAFSQGAVIWVFISEIFPNKVRAKGQTLGSFTHWFMAAAISWTFPAAADSAVIGGGKAFAFFSCMMFLQLFFAWKVLPETKGKSLEQIEKELGMQKNNSPNN